MSSSNAFCSQARQSLRFSFALHRNRTFKNYLVCRPKTLLVPKNHLGRLYRLHLFRRHYDLCLAVHHQVEWKHLLHLVMSMRPEWTKTHLNEVSGQSISRILVINGVKKTKKKCINWECTSSLLRTIELKNMCEMFIFRIMSSFVRYKIRLIRVNWFSWKDSQNRRQLDFHLVLSAQILDPC